MLGSAGLEVINRNRRSGDSSRTNRWATVIAICAAGLSHLVATCLRAESPRVSRGLQVLYTFDAGRGDTVTDRSGTKPTLDLKIEKQSAVEWKAGALVVRSPTRIRSSTPATKIFTAVRRSGAVTIEAWITPGKVSQDGPARIVTLSADANQRNVTVGQDGKRYDVRLRTTSTSKNGLPSTAAANNSAKTQVTHLVYTRDAAGNARIFINGRQQTAKRVAGKMTNWDDDFRLSLANEVSGERPWLGTYYLVAVYSRALTGKEVAQNFNAGAQAAATPAHLATNRPSPAAEMFETKVAALFARRCVECHDPSTKKGGLDLSQKVTALAGGESGKVIVPGKAAASLLWKSVEADDMPEEGDPLSAAEKQLLRKWIDAGADWTIDTIDPALYVYDNRAQGIWLQRLTRPEYIETVRRAVGVDIEKDARQILPPDLRADGFTNTAYNLNVDLKHVESYAKLAEIIVERMDVAAFAKRFSRSRRLIDKDNRELIAKMGKWLLRGPLDEREIVAFRGISTTVASAGGDFDEATRYVIEAMLQSPRFVYRVENQRGDGTAWPVGDFELASRMSYILWGGPPDEKLVQAADKGELQDRSKLTAEVKRLLADPRAVDHSVQFVSEWLNLDRLRNLKPNGKRFPSWNPSLADDMRRETVEFFKEIAWKQQRPLSDLFNAQVTFATPRLARHYGLKPSGDSLARYDLSRTPSRGGLLTQGSVLTIGGDDASMVTRGLFVLQSVLRGTVKDPPPGLDTTPVPTRPGASHRHIAELRIKNVACGGCHSKIEPLAFGLERFNGIGAYQKQDEHGNRLREDGEILVPGTAKPVAYKSAAELMNLLAGSGRVQESVTWKLTQFALGRPLTAADAQTVQSIHQAAQTQGGTYSSVMTAIVMSDLVQMTRTETDSVKELP